jgi:hypothetical protein
MSLGCHSRQKKKTRKKPGKTGPELERLSLEIG